MIWTVERVIKEAHKYDNITAMACRSSGAVNAMHRYDIKDQVDAVFTMKRKNKLVAAEGSIRAAAKKFKSLTSFRSRSRKMYRMAEELGILDDICAHMITPTAEWTDQELLDHGKTFDTRTDFSFRGTNVARECKRRGIYEQACEHMISRSRPRRDMSSSDIRAIALTYNSRFKFQQGSSYEYQAARQRGILEEICTHMIAKPPQYTDDELRSCARQFTTRSEFEKKEHSKACIARNRGIHDDICSHMEALPSKHVWTKTEVLTEALHYDSPTAFLKGSSAAHRAALKLGILDKAKKHMISNKWSNDQIREEALNYTTRGQLQLQHPSVYQIATTRRILDDVCAHMPDVVRWTPALLHIEAKKHLTRADFAIVRGAYSSATRMGILDEVCAHMKPQLNYWDYESIHAASIKYDTKTEFLKEDHLAYGAAVRRNILDKICTHMK